MNDTALSIRHFHGTREAKIALSHVQAYDVAHIGQGFGFDSGGIEKIQAIIIDQNFAPLDQMEVILRNRRLLTVGDRCLRIHRRRRTPR